jgi:hypothetical protein
MPKQTLQVEVPEGYELTGEFRVPESGELILMDGEAVGFSKFTAPLISKWFPILRKTERWRPAIATDVRYPYKKARLRDSDKDQWQYCNLVGLGYRGDRIVWVGDGYINFHYWQCEVLCD